MRTLERFRTSREGNNGAKRIFACARRTCMEVGSLQGAGIPLTIGACGAHGRRRSH